LPYVNIEDGIKLLELAHRAHALLETQPAHENGSGWILYFRTHVGRTGVWKLTIGNPLI